MNVEQIFQQVMNENCPDPLHRFAELVAAAERKACAKLSDEHDDDVRMAISRAIRARGEKHENNIK